MRESISRFRVSQREINGLLQGLIGVPGRHDRLLGAAFKLSVEHNIIHDVVDVLTAGTPGAKVNAASVQQLAQSLREVWRNIAMRISQQQHKSWVRKRDVLWQILDAFGLSNEYDPAGFARVSNWHKRQAKLPLPGLSF